MTFSKNLVRLFSLAVLLVLSMTSVLAQSDGRVRFVHVVPGADAVNVFVNGVLAVDSLAYGTASDYINAPSGDHNVQVQDAENGTEIWQQVISVGEGRATTFVASKPSFTPFNENLGATGLGNTRLLLVHAVDGAPAVDVSLAESISLNGVEQAVGTKIATGMAYDTSFGSFDLPAQKYVVNVSAGDTNILENITLNLDNSTTYFAIVYGTPDAPEALLLAQMTTLGEASGLVRVIHAVVGAPAVDIFADDTLLAENLGAGTATVHMSVPVGTYDIAVKPTGTDDILAQTSLTVSASEAKTMVAVDATAAVALIEVLDDISAPASTSTRAAINVLNAIPMSVLSTLTLGDNAFLEEPLPYAESLTFTLDPSKGDLVYTVATPDGTGDSEMPVTFYGGTYYNLVLVNDDGVKVLVFPTSITQAIGSAPNSTDNLVAAPVVEQPAVVTPAPVVEQPVTPPTTSGNANEITGRVLLNPDANLQLRQYPNSVSLSLGLAPSSAVLVINGREGAPVALVEGQAPPPEAESWVDPVALLLDADADLDPTQTWLNVTFTAPEGGRIVAWVNAQFLDVRNGRGERVKLRDLIELVGGNVPGTASGNTGTGTTTTSPTTITTDTTAAPDTSQVDGIAAIVFDLNPTANLNIRRFPSTDDEVLGQVPNATVLNFVGSLETDDWAFVEYNTPDGNIVSGWVSTAYLRYEYGGRTYNIETVKDVIERGTSQALFEFVPATQGGEVRFGEGAVTAAPAPTVSPQRNTYVGLVLLQPSANLQLRRYADATSESLGLIPGNSEVVVDGRDIEANWFYVESNGLSGWVSAQFVRVTFNGRSVDLVDVPIASANPMP